jgi:CRP-like cAMP-binding protein
MKEIRNQEQLKSFLDTYHLKSVFNDQLTPYLSLYSFDQGELICSQGDVSQYLYVLVKGKVKIYTTSSEGKTLILTFKTPLEIIGDIEYVRNIEIINTVEAVSPLLMIGIEYRWLHKYGKNHAPLLQFLLDIITQKFHMNSNSLRLNVMYPVEVRLASYLLSVCFDESDEHFSGQLSTGSLKDAANLIGTSYRHLNRVIQRFCAEGMVDRKNGLIIVKNRLGLEALVSDNIYE